MKAKLKVPFIKIYIAFSLRPALTINRFVAQEIPTLFFTFFHLHFVPRFPKKNVSLFIFFSLLSFLTSPPPHPYILKILT